ncbi:MAG: helix-turn-helix domain-containing protein [Rhodothermales bacterium]
MPPPDPLVIVSKAELRALIADVVDEKLKSLHAAAHQQQAVQSKWLNTSDARALTGFSRTKLWRLRKDGRLTGTTIDGRVYYGRENIEGFLER